MKRVSITEVIRHRAKADDIALVQEEQQLTYGDLFAEMDRFADMLPPRGRCQRIGVRLPSGLHYIPVALAVLAAGHCFVPIAEELTPTEVAELCHRTAVEWILTGDAQSPTLAKVEAVEPSFSDEAFQDLNPAFIRFSSGTTGRSKGVVLSHESLLARIDGANQGLRLTASDRILWVLPMAHHFAVSIVLYLYAGATTVIAESRLGEDLLRTGAGKRVTVMYGSPAHYRQLCAHAGMAEGAALAQSVGGPWPTLRLAVSTAAALDVPTAEAFRGAFGQPLVQAFGIIEAGLPMMNLSHALSAPESLGRPLPGYEVKLRPMNDAGGESMGELLIRGPGFFDAYLDPWQLAADVLEQGWLATGDVVRLSDEGLVTVCGRSKSVVNLGGMKVFPEEVEQAMEMYPGIQRAFVTSATHALYGEVLVGHFIQEADAEAVSVGGLRKFLRGRLAEYKVPAKLRAVNELPVTASGKLLRHGSYTLNTLP